MTGEAVQHPKHYRHPSGAECIDLIRHYTCDIANAIKYIWSAGLKGEYGMTIREKEIEDCRKSLWYLHDYLHNPIGGHCISLATHPSRLSCEAVAACYDEDMAEAFRLLWNVGVIVDGYVVRTGNERRDVLHAIDRIKSRISRLEAVDSE